MNRNRTSSIPQPSLDRPRPVYNDSFNQPDEPFECDLSAILPQHDDDDEDDDLSISDTEDYQDDSLCSSFQETTGHDAYRPTSATTASNINQHHHSNNSQQQQNHPQDTLHSRYLEVESASWPAAHQEDEVAGEGDYEDDEEEEEEEDPFLGGGRARLSTIAELSELPSINLNHNHNGNLRSHYNPHRTPTTPNTTSTNNNTSATARGSGSRRLESMQSGQVVISRDLVLEDLFVEGQEEAERAEEEIRQQLMANLKPTDILGPIHETRDFQISSLTGQGGRHWERQEKHVPQDEDGQNDEQEEEEDEENNESEHDSFIREEGESDLSSTALALKREYEALFGSKGAIDSERSGSDANGLLGYDNSDDLYPRGEEDEDEDDDFFGDDYDEEEDEEEEEFYAMLDLNGGGGGNMILGNNIPRKPRVLAPPPGSRLPVPGASVKEKVPLALQSKIVSRLPAARMSPLPSATNSARASPAPSSPAPVQSVSRIVPPATGLRPPQVVAKRGPETMSNLPAPSTPAAAATSSSQPSKPTGSILDGLWKEQEYDSHPEESPGAIFAAKVAKELMKEKRESQLAAQNPRPSMLKPPSRLPARSTVVMPENDVERMTNILKVEEAPSTTTATTPRPKSKLTAPTPVSKLARPSIVPPRVRSVASPSPSRSQTSSPIRAPSKSPIPSNSSGSSPRSVATITKSKAETPALGQRSGVMTPKNHSKTHSFAKDPSMDVSMEQHQQQQERPQELAGRSSAERKRHLQQQLELIEAEEAEEAAAAAEAEDKRLAASRKLSVRTSEVVEHRRSRDLQQSINRRSSERERERERGSVPTSPLSPLSPHRSAGISSKRSSLYDMNGDRKVPTLEESCKVLAKIRQDIVELREEIYQDQPGTSFPSPTSTGPSHPTTGKRPSGRDREREQDREAHSRRNSLENKAQHGGRETRPQLGRSDSYHSSAPSSPEAKASTRRHFFGDILGKLSRNSLHVSTSGPVPSTATTSQQSKTSPTYRKGQAPHSQSHPPKPLSRSIMDSEHQQPTAVIPRTPTTAYPGGRSSTHRHSTQPMSPSRDKQMIGYEDRYHSGSSGQSAEFYDEPAYYDQYQYPASTSNNPYKQSQSAMSASHRARQQQQQQQQQQQRLLGSNQMSHHFRQAHDGGLILSDSPPFASSAMADGADYGAGCPAQIRPKELRFSNSVAGEIHATVTLSNRSSRTMHYEILRPAGISVSPSFGMIQPGRDQRLAVHLAENRGPGRVVVELDGEWLVPFGISFD
ncbi:hypothetical protein BGX29_008651 [Mortierella sp. GBA35]|nr:hypothetical protein BGX29_008651 [Mortierella sp. GBA35]